MQDAKRQDKRKSQTLARMVSSRGVAEPIVENWRPTFEKPRAYRRYMVREELAGGMVKMVVVVSGAD